MKNVKILDCSLRDGGRIIDCAFPDSHIKGICKGLANAKIDIVEMGFLRGNLQYKGNSTFFTEIDQLKQFIPEEQGNTMYVAFSDYGEEYGMWDFSRIKPCDGTSITGMRVGYRKKDLREAIETFHIVKDNGYKLFIQGVESLNYTDKEMLETIDVINQIKPHSFGIVDTYGAMYKDDVLRLFNLVDHNLDEDIAIDFHSHNNMQLSFSFAQEIVECSRGKREIVLDATMEGLGKGTGNLNTELIMDYLMRKHNYVYDIDALFDTIDEYIDWIKAKDSWTYSIPYFMAGIYSSHANNIIYLMDKHRLNTKDIKHILSMIEPQQRKRYNYDNIEKLYVEYSSKECNDRDVLCHLKKEFSSRPVLVMVPGKTLKTQENLIQKAIKEEDPIIISVNHIHGKGEEEYSFFGNQRRYNRLSDQARGDHVILASNVDTTDEKALLVNYNQLVDMDLKYFDNSAVMLFNLLRRVGIEKFMVAGLDGLDNPEEDGYYQDGYDSKHRKDDYMELNKDIDCFLRNYAKSLSHKEAVRFITKSRFAYIFLNPES